MIKEKKLKNKIIILFFIISVFSVNSIAKYIRVPIFIPNKTNIDLKKYDKIVIQQYNLVLPELDIKYKKVFENFFLIELEKNINKEVEFITEKLISIDPIKSKKIVLKKKIPLDEKIKTRLINTLLITMDMKLTVDKRHVISEEKDKYGDTLKSFEKKIVWELESDIKLVDVNSEILLRNYKIKKKLTKKKRSSKQFNFKYLFDNTMRDFLKRFIKKGHIERRYLLSQLNKVVDHPKLRNS